MATIDEMMLLEKEKNTFFNNYTYFWSSTIVVAEAYRFDFRELLAHLPSSENKEYEIAVSINSAHHFHFEICFRQNLVNFKPEVHMECVSRAIVEIYDALREAYVGKLDLGF